MATADYSGAWLAALGRYKVIIAGAVTAQEIQVPALKEGDAYTDGVSSNGNAAKRVCRLIIALGTGAVTLYDSDTSGHVAAANTIWAMAATTAGNVYALDIPLLNRLFITVAASTTVVVTFT